jgi:glycosyltransferase involved in cell wall biosynthesis
MGTRPDVTLVAPYPPNGELHGGHSGVASYTANLARALSGAGMHVTVVAPELDGDPTTFRDGDIEVQRRFTLGPRALPAAIAAAAETRAPVSHLQFELFLYGGASSLLGLGPALGRARWGLGSSLVTTMHQVVDPGTVDRRYTRLHRVPAPAPVARAGIAALQGAVARASQATIVHEASFTRTIPSATVIPHGIEVAAPLDRDSARAALGLGDRFVALCFGFVAPYKGVELVLEASRHAGPDVDIVVAGGEHPRLQDEAGGFAASLASRFRDAARFTGWVPDGDVARWFSAADVALFPYPKPFSASGALALALAYGTPALLSPPLARSVGAPNVMTVPLDPRAIAGRLDDLAAKPDALDDLRAWSTVLADGRRWPAVAQRHIQLYEEVARNVERDARRRLRAG